MRRRSNFIGIHILNSVCNLSKGILNKLKIALLPNCRRRVYPAIVSAYAIKMKHRGIKPLLH